MVKLDKIDLSILENLQKNGRMTNVDLASKAGISAPPCLRRLKSLEESGVIKGYYAEINHSVVGYNFEALCFVTLNSQNATDIEKFVNEVTKFKNIRSCTAIIGGADFILRVVDYDFKHFEDFLSNKFSKIDGIAQIKSLIIMKEYKDERGVPIEI